jgi:hypothetical protein
MDNVMIAQLAQTVAGLGLRLLGTSTVAMTLAHLRSEGLSESVRVQKNMERRSAGVCLTVGGSSIAGNVVLEMVLARERVMGYAPKWRLACEEPSCSGAAAGGTAAGVVGDAAADDVAEPWLPVLQVRTWAQMRQMAAG